MPPIEAMVAVVIAGVIGWFVFRPFFAAGTIPGRKRKISVTTRTSSSRARRCIRLRGTRLSPARTSQGA